MGKGSYKVGTRLPNLPISVDFWEKIHGVSIYFLTHMHGIGVPLSFVIANVTVPVKLEPSLIVIICIPTLCDAKFFFISLT